MKVCLRRVLLQDFPAFAIVELHPVIFSILDFSSVFQSLSKEIAKVVVVGGVFEAEIANVREVFVEFLCFWLA